MHVTAAVVVCIAGVAALVAAVRGAKRHPEWSWRSGPARWLGTLGTALLLGGALNLWIWR